MDKDNSMKALGKTVNKGSPLKTLFPIDSLNTSTWPWKTYVVTGMTATGIIIKWIKNDKFKYGNLIEGY
jgi:hypothetical protein